MHCHLGVYEDLNHDGLLKSKRLVLCLIQIKCADKGHSLSAHAASADRPIHVRSL